MPAVEGGAAGVGRRDRAAASRVCHFPPGTSKWNKIEHRLFCHITQNWRGRPLVSHEVIVNLIANTTTQAGLKIRAELDRGIYPVGVKVTDAELGELNLKRPSSMATGTTRSFRHEERIDQLNFTRRLRARSLSSGAATCSSRRLATIRSSIALSPRPSAIGRGRADCRRQGTESSLGHLVRRRCRTRRPMGLRSAPRSARGRRAARANPLARLLQTAA